MKRRSVIIRSISIIRGLFDHAQLPNATSGILSRPTSCILNFAILIIEVIPFPGLVSTDTRLYTVAQALKKRLATVNGLSESSFFDSPKSAC